MNVFFLDTNPTLAAMYHADGHINKMISESGQLLATAIRLKHGTKQTVEVTSAKGITRKRTMHVLPCDTILNGILIKYQVPLDTHHNHPCAKWVRESNANFRWLYRLAHSLHAVWTQTMGRNNHASYLRMVDALLHYENWVFDEGHDVSAPLTRPALSMPAEFGRLHESNPLETAVDSYRAYYQAKLNGWRADPNKVQYAKYTNRPVPRWLDNDAD